MPDRLNVPRAHAASTTASSERTDRAVHHRCSHCGHAGSDILVKSCQNGCAYHARCIDLVSIARRLPNPALSAGLAPAAANQGGELHTLAQCPCCSGPAAGLEMIPLSLGEIDQARRLGGCKDTSVSSKPTSQPGKRSALDMDAAQEANFYDPEHPRTGKWSDEEIAFRDALVPHFVDGNLPLLNGLKLIDFLSAMLKSKPSRLTKKMKHAKLSTRHFHLESGHIPTPARAHELGNLEVEFVNSISDAVERSEIKFHMQREWRDHLAERLTLLRISFDAEAWLKSVDAMDRRITLAKSRNRAVKRRLMMGKAFEKDTSSPTPGIFINNDAGEEGDVDFELLANALAKDDAEDDDLKALFTSLAGESGATADAGGASQGGAAHEVSADDSGQSAMTTLARGASSGSGATSPGSAEPSMPPPPFRSALLPSLGSSDGPNFRSAAPFLAKITGYIERNQYPFEHIDIWVPSSSDPVAIDPTGATAPEPSLLGSGSTSGQGGRLCFAGSASVGVQVLPDEAPADLMSDSPSGLPQVPSFGYQSRKPSVPLTSDEMYHLSLFGSYSSKFSFSSGSGLPGRVFQSNIPAWEQFVSNAPSELFERRGGAMQFGIKTALGLPVQSPNVGRIVVVLYSRHDRVKDDALVGQICRDFGSLGPCPRWKLMVDMGTGAALSAGAGVAIEQAQLANSESQASLQGPGLSEKNVQVSNLIALLGENMPSDASTPLGMQLNNIMTLRMVLLKTQRTPEEEHLVDSTITLFHSYVQAGRSRPDITLMLARDFAFHSQIAQQQQAMPSQAHMQRQGSLPHMANLSIGSALGQHQVSSGQLDHLDHSLDHSDRSAPIQIQAQQLAPSELDRRSVSLGSTPDGYAVGQPMSVSLSSVTERNYSSPPKSALTEMLEGKRVSMPTSEPPASLNA
ncbi:hypothetical protein ACHAXT_003510 [Thalassiosira profunda]